MSGTVFSPIIACVVSAVRNTKCGSPGVILSDAGGQALLPSCRLRHGRPEIKYAARDVDHQIFSNHLFRLNNRQIHLQAGEPGTQL